MDKNESLAEITNRHCLCQTLDKNKLQAQLEKQINFETLFHDRPNLFSQTTIYISKEDLKKIEITIESLEAVIKTQSFKDKVLKLSPTVALNDFAPHGVFMGYDFHLTKAGPKLIEINTNAGGGFLNLILAKAQVACCEGIKQPFDLMTLENKFWEMFLAEWKLQRGDAALTSIAIIDENPQAQYLYPEFQLFSELFKKSGIECLILNPQDLILKEGELWFEAKKIDMIYNRSTDFYFESSLYAAIKEAYVSGKVVATPNPHHHALYANKLNLEILTNPACLTELKIDSSIIENLQEGIPKTIRLTPENEKELWEGRRNYFFKPASGFGSKAAYRGDKITLKVWKEINSAVYVAQEIARPGIRVVQVGEEQSELKLDIRAYTYDGKIQLLASRLYAGQTTNFRTLGGGFAPVFLL
ncbi:MAG: hypothetical protein H0V66_03200 [Bdellovibrionales bacterium]|nr:hypothetical protein [Bdellovibrionales bacterium]